MNRQLITALFLTLNFSCIAQVIFEKGYLIDNNDQKINCLIRNKEWKNNPEDFEYKIDNNSIVKIGSLENVKEFGVSTEFRFVRCTVDMDRSSDKVGKLTVEREAEFREEILFLRVLVEGEASLYHFEDGSLNRFFYQLDNSEILQLVYKRYFISPTEAGVNNRYRQQLSNELNCENGLRVENLEYQKNSLVKFFIKYNECKNSEFTSYYKKWKKGSFHLGIRAGYQINTLLVDGPFFSASDFKIQHKPGYRIGVSAELTLPFNKNKWAVLFEPNLQLFKAETTLESDIFLDRAVAVKANTVELPVGVRYYFFLNNDSKVFINFLSALDIQLSTYVDIERTADLPNTTPLILSSVGAGYSFKSNYNFEIRYMIGKDLLNDYATWGGKLSGFSFILGVNLF
ncbi:MAG: hypothetical protein R2825_17870 [Saprospiraceae bacterium]